MNGTYRRPDPESPILSPFWTTEEAAQYCRVSLTTMQELLRTRSIVGRRVGRQWRILKSDLDRYLGMTPDGEGRKAR